MNAGEVRRWSQKAREATVRRNEAIRAMRAAGRPLMEIAEAAGLSHTAIAKIVKSDPTPH